MLTSEVVSVKRNIWRFRTTATVDEELASSALLMCAYQDKGSLG